jgi:hypothetical protein
MIADHLFMALKIILASSIFFVWVVRYENIIKEFSEYGFPNWFRDFIGIIKISFCGILISGNADLLQLAAGSMAILMAAAFVTHIKFKHTLQQMLPSLGLLTICAILFINS